MCKKLLVITFVTLALAMSAVNVGAVPLVETGWGPISFNIGAAPKRLPAHKMAPVSLSLSGRISSRSGGSTPSLREATVDFDKNATVNALGLPICSKYKLESLTSAHSVGQQCGTAVIGTGNAHVLVPSSQSPVPTHLILLNGGIKAHTIIIFVYAMIAAPATESVVSTFTVKKIHRGRFGLEGTAKIPSIDSGRGSLADFNFKVTKRFVRNGVKQSFLMASCPDGHLDAGKWKFVFSTGENFAGKTLVRPCIPKA